MSQKEKVEILGEFECQIQNTKYQIQKEIAIKTNSKIKMKVQSKQNESKIMKKKKFHMSNVKYKMK